MLSAAGLPSTLYVKIQQNLQEDGSVAAAVGF